VTETNSSWLLVCRTRSSIAGLAVRLRTGCGDSGFTLVEALVAMFVTTLILLTIAELLVTGLYVHRSASDVTETTALAQERLEELRNRPYHLLASGGSIAVNSAGFSENLDIDGDGNNDYSRRWQVVDLGDPADALKTARRLGRATERLQRDLNKQRVVWLVGRHLPHRVELGPAARGISLAGGASGPSGEIRQ